MCPLSSSSGTVSVNVSVPWSRRIAGDRLVVGEVLGELRDAAVVAELLLDRGVAAQVADHQLEPRHDERRLSRPAEEPVELEGGVLGEDLAVGPEPDRGCRSCVFATRPPLRVSPDFSWNDASGPSPEKTPGTPRRKLMPCCEGVRSTSTSSRADSALTTEAPTPCRPPVATYDEPPNLPPACSLVKTTSTPAQPGLGLLVDRDAAPVVVHLGRAVGVEGDLDQVAGAGQGLVHAVVDDLPQAVHETAGVGGPDVHARALADRLQPLEDEEVCCVVGVVGDRAAPGSCGGRWSA